MAGHRLIDDHLAELARHLPAGVVDELADGLIETWQHHRTAGLTPARAAQDAIAEFGSVERILDAYVAHSPARRTARLLLTTGPLVGAGWGAALVATGFWTWHVPGIAVVVFAAALAGVVATLAVSATARRSYRRARLGMIGGLSLIGLDVTMIAVVLSAAPALSRLIAVAVALSLIRVTLTVRAVRRSFART
jgi:hypothetical protein